MKLTSISCVLIAFAFSACDETSSSDARADLRPTDASFEGTLPDDSRPLDVKPDVPKQTCVAAGYRCCARCDEGAALPAYDESCGARRCCAKCYEAPPVETHYVSQGGGNETPHTGASWDSAWSLEEFHEGSHWSDEAKDDGLIGPGDAVFFRGDIEEQIVITRGGSEVGAITFDGWEGGDCDPINSECTEAAFAKKGITIGGGNAGPDYVTLQDFEITNTVGTGSGILIFGKKTVGTEDENMITHVVVQRNYVHETNGALFFVSSYGEAGPYEHLVVRGNKMLHFGQNGGDPAQGVNLVNMRHSLVQGNELGHDDAKFPSGCRSAELIELHGCHQIVLEYNNIYGAPNQSGIRPKEWDPQSDIVIRFNKVHDNHSRRSGGQQSGKGIYAYGAVIDDIYIYGNYIYNNHQWGVGASRTVTGMRVWSNVISANGQHGFISFPNNGSGQSEFLIYNNTLVRNGDRDENEKSRGGIVLTEGSGFYIANNVLWNNRPGGAGSSYYQIYSLQAIDVLEHNSYYHDASPATVFYDNGVRSLADLRDGYQFEDDDPGGAIEDVDFVDPEGPDGVFGSEDDDYSLKAGSPAIGAARALEERYSIDLSGGDAWFEAQTGYSTIEMSTSTALDPATSWKGQPSPASIKTADQNDHGKWERGAYVFR